MSPILKLSSPETREYWEVPILFEDDDLLAIDKPAGLLSSPDRYDPKRPNLMGLLHGGIARGIPWAKERGLTYLANVHRLDFETSGVLLLTKSKPVLVALANQFGSEKPVKEYGAFVRGGPRDTKFEVNARLSPDTIHLGRMRVDEKRGKKAITLFQVAESFRGYTFLHCQPLTGRTHQIRVHLRWKRLPILGDNFYGGSPLLLSRLKPDYRPRRDNTERPLINRLALHAHRLTFQHPASGASITVTAPWPKDFSVALKYLRRFASPRGGSTQDLENGGAPDSADAPSMVGEQFDDAERNNDSAAEQESSGDV